MPVPPDVQAQGQPQPQGGPSINRPPPPGSGAGGGAPPNGPSQGEMMQQIKSATDQFEQVTGQLYGLLTNADPESKALFVTLAETGKAIKERVAQLEQKAGQGASTPAAAPPATNPAEAPQGPVGMAA